MSMQARDTSRGAQPLSGPLLELELRALRRYLMRRRMNRFFEGLLVPLRRSDRLSTSMEHPE
jgi:hypothetical protein